MDSLWMHPANVSTPEAAPTGRPPPVACGPFQHREMLVCSLCVYSLEGGLLPVDPSPHMLQPADLRSRLESSGLAVDAPAAMRLNSRRWEPPAPPPLESPSDSFEVTPRSLAPTRCLSHVCRCILEPLSFAVELCTKNIGIAQLPQHLLCLESGRLQLQLKLGEYAHIKALLPLPSRSPHAEPTPM